jgi:hypothetical protein
LVITLLADLALMAGSDVPFYVVVEVWPPEAVEEVSPDGEYSFVSERVVDLSDQFESPSLRYVSLMFAVPVTAPKSVVEDEVVRGEFGKLGEVVFRDVERPFEVAEERVHEEDPVVGHLCLLRPGDGFVVGISGSAEEDLEHRLRDVGIGAPGDVLTNDTEHLVMGDLRRGPEVNELHKEAVRFVDPIFRVVGFRGVFLDRGSS